MKFFHGFKIKVSIFGKLIWPGLISFAFLSEMGGYFLQLLMRSLPLSDPG